MSCGQVHRHVEPASVFGCGAVPFVRTGTVTFGGGSSGDSHFSAAVRVGTVTFRLGRTGCQQAHREALWRQQCPLSTGDSHFSERGQSLFGGGSSGDSHISAGPHRVVSRLTVQAFLAASSALRPNGDSHFSAAVRVGTVTFRRRFEWGQSLFGGGSSGDSHFSAAVRVGTVTFRLGRTGCQQADRQRLWCEQCPSSERGQSLFGGGSSGDSHLRVVSSVVSADSLSDWGC